MTGLASVQTAADSAALTWGYVLAALTAAACFAAPFLLAAYLESPLHRRRAQRQQTKGHRT